MSLRKSKNNNGSVREGVGANQRYQTSSVVCFETPVLQRKDRLRSIRQRDQRWLIPDGIFSIGRSGIRLCSKFMLPASVCAMLRRGVRISVENTTFARLAFSLQGELANARISVGRSLVAGAKPARLRRSFRTVQVECTDGGLT
jgi:hypothetical protein